MKSQEINIFSLKHVLAHITKTGKAAKSSIRTKAENSSVQNMNRCSRTLKNLLLMKTVLTEHSAYSTETLFQQKTEQVLFILHRDSAKTTAKYSRDRVFQPLNR